MSVVIIVRLISPVTSRTSVTSSSVGVGEGIYHLHYTLGLADELGDADALGDGDSDTLALGEALKEAEALGDNDALGDTELDGDAL
jgi:hypothetical protein